MKPGPRRYVRIRILLVGAVFSVCLMVIGARAVYIQVFQGAWLSSLAADQYEKSFTARGMRGSIYDARHREMAVSLEGASIAAYPPRIADVAAAARAVGGVLDIQPAVVKAKLTTDRGFVWLKRQASPRETEAVKALELAGIDFRTEPVRFYPHRTLAAQVLGFSGVDGRGLDGLEFYYDAFLKGDPDRFRVLKDAHGRGFAADKNSLPDNRGNNIILTIDQTIQFICENALAAAVADSSALSAMAVVIAPASGAILALAHFPRFNPNRFRDYDNRLRRNRAITDAFEPGSILKIFTAAAALESGLCSPNTIFFCENGVYRLGRETIHDTHPHAWLSLQQIVKYSSNIGMAKVGEMVGSQRLYDTLTAFGFGAKTGIDKVEQYYFQRQKSQVIVDANR